MSINTHPIPELNRRGLREFGLVTGGILAALFGLFFPWLLASNIPVWPWVAGGILAVWALVAPESLRPVHYGWMRFALLLSRITTPIILGAVFFLVIMPMGVVMRLFRHDPMARKLDDNAKSYRVSTHKARRENMEKPF